MGLKAAGLYADPPHGLWQETAARYFGIPIELFDAWFGAGNYPDYASLTGRLPEIGIRSSPDQPPSLLQ